MRASVRESSSQMSGSSSTIKARGLAMGSGLLPALRVREYDAEDAAASRARLVDEKGAVALGELAGNEEAKARAARARREERLEDAIADRRIDAGTAVEDFEERAVAAGEPSDADLHLVFRDLHRVAEGVFAEIPQDLVQVRRVDPHFELRVRGVRLQLARLVAAGADEFLREVGEPFGERHSLGPRALAAGELLYVADDRADPFGVGLDDVAETAAGLRDAGVLAEELG